MEKWKLVPTNVYHLLAVIKKGKINTLVLAEKKVDVVTSNGIVNKIVTVGIAIDGAAQFEIDLFVPLNTMVVNDVDARILFSHSVGQAAVWCLINCSIRIVERGHSHCSNDALPDSHSLCDGEFAVSLVTIRYDNNELVTDRELCKFVKCAPTPDRIVSYGMTRRTVTGTLIVTPIARRRRLDGRNRRPVLDRR